MPWFLIAALIVGLAGLFVLMQPKVKVENARAQGLNDLQFPRAAENAPIPPIWGRIRTKGPNTLWVGDFLAKPIKKKVKTGLFSSTKQIVGYQYFVGLQLGLGMGPCTLHRIWCDKEILWEGTANVDGQALVINKPNLFGGKEKGGGFTGTIRFYTGGWTQGINAYMEGIIGAGDVPAYRGTCYVVLEHCNIGETDQLRPLSFELSRYSNDLAIPDGKNLIGDDLNPMELLFQVFTADWGGLNVDVGMFNIEVMQTVALTLYDESNGMSLIVSQSNDGKTITQEVMRQIDGLLYCNPQEGNIVTKLIRKDYDIDDLPVFDESNILAVRNFNSKLWEDTINQVRVTFTDRAKKYEESSAMDQDLANINSQDRIRSTTQSFPGVNNATLAQEIASRELAQGSVPLMAVQLETNREASQLRPGDCFVWAWDPYRISRVVMRVRDFDLGSLSSNKIVFQATQDEFAIGATTFTPPSSSGGNVPPPDDPATAAVTRLVTEGSFFFANASAINISDVQGIILVAAEAPDIASLEYDIYTSNNGGANYDLVKEHVAYTTHGSLNTAVTAAANLSTGVIPSLTVTAEVDDFTTNTAAEIGQGNGLVLIDNELCAYESYTDNGDRTITLTNVWRALLDTAPLAHGIGAQVWLITGDAVVDDPFGSTDTVRVKIVTRSFRDEIDITTVPYDSITLNKRAARPLRPANVKFDAGTAFSPPAVGTGSHTITWANRSRKSLVVRKITDNTNEYESGQQTVFRYRKNAGAWVQALIAPGVTTYTFDAAAAGGDTVDYELYSTRDSFDSLSKWTFTAGAASGGGSVPDSGTQDGGGSTPTDGNGSYTDTSNKCAIVFPFGKDIGTDPIDIPITFALTIPAALAGANVDHDINPAATATFTFKDGSGTTLGTIAISTGGVYTLTAASAIKCAAGSSLKCYPPAVGDSTLKGVNITVAATKDP
jgi:hypothetical protein